MQKNPCRVDDPLQNPIDRESYEDAVSLEDGIYPITTDDNTIISSDMVSHGSGTVEDALDSVSDSVSALETKVTPQIIFPSDSVSFTNGNAWIANSDFPFAHFMPMAAQCVGANTPCVVSIDSAGVGVFVTLPINTTFTGSLDVIIYGIGWN